MSNLLNDHDLTVLVDAAASGAVTSRAARHGGPTGEDLDASSKNNVREAALTTTQTRIEITGNIIVHHSITPQPATCHALALQ